MADLMLALETSCDDTAVALVEKNHSLRVIVNLISSQVQLHSRYGGVVPEIASRQHLKTAPLLVAEALRQGGVGLQDLSAIAVTAGPGLVGALLVGVSLAKGLSFGTDLPLVAVNHLEGHIYANFLLDHLPPFPLVALLVSGGHTALVYMSGHGSFRLLGETRDDAAGEAFDKIARAMNMGYPGGPLIEAAAEKGNPEKVPLPRARLQNPYEFSFSGVKTALLQALKNSPPEVSTADFAAGFQWALVEPLVEKSLKAVKETGARCLCMAGGVAANGFLRRRMEAACREAGIPLIYPPKELCTDNGAMIAAAGWYRFRDGRLASPDLNAAPGLELTGWN